jgi:hypothetical protein
LFLVIFNRLNLPIKMIAADGMSPAHPTSFSIGYSFGCPSSTYFILQGVRE